MTLGLGFGLSALSPAFGLAEAPGSVTGPWVDLDFQTGLYWRAGEGRAAFADLPGLTLARAGSALAKNEAGDYETFTANTPRLTDKGLLIEEVRTNVVSRSAFTGGVTGSPGTLPTGVSFTAPGGLTRTLAFGTAHGLAYMDVTMVGTLAADWSPTFVFDTTTAAAAQNQVWSAGVFAQLMAGAVIPGLRLRIRAMNAGAGIVTSPVAAITITSAFTRHRLEGQTLTHADTTQVRLEIQTSAAIPAGTAVDFTIRFYCPQLELGAYLSSPILTTGVAATRPADVIYLTLPSISEPVSIVTDTLIEHSDATVGFHVAALSDGTASNRLRVGRFAPDAVFARGDAGGVSNVLAANLAGKGGARALKIGLGHDGAASLAAVDGEALAVTWNGAVPTGMTRLDIGSLLGASQLNGWFKALRLYRRGLTQDELISETA